MGGGEGGGSTGLGNIPKKQKNFFDCFPQYNWQYIPRNSALLAQETLFLTKKGTFFCPKKALLLPTDFQKLRKPQQILISRRNSSCLGLTFSSKSKLFSVYPSCLRTTSATLVASKPLICPFSSWNNPFTLKRRKLC